MSDVTELFELFERADRGAYNQALFRQVNEQIRALKDDPKATTEFGAPKADSDWVCECANAGCMQQLTMSRGDYANVRSSASRFLVAPAEEHVFSDIEQVMERNRNYWVVEKTGTAKAVAEDLYQRWHD